jgi:hypothetical protein
MPLLGGRLTGQSISSSKRTSSHARAEAARVTLCATVQDAMLYVIVGVVAVSAVLAVVALAGSGRAWDEVGRGPMSIGDGGEGPARGPLGAVAAPGSAQERDDEVRQMLEARNARRRARGQDPVDVEAELARLTAAPAPVDAGLRAEVRALVEARNARRARRGQEPLDFDAEVERRLRDLGTT